MSQLSESISCYMLSEWSRIVFLFLFSDSCLWVPCLAWTVKLPSVLQKILQDPQILCFFRIFEYWTFTDTPEGKTTHYNLRMLSCHVRLRETLTLTLDPDSYCLRSDAQRNSSTLSIHFMMACLVRSDLLGISNGIVYSASLVPCWAHLKIMNS